VLPAAFWYKVRGTPEVSSHQNPLSLGAGRAEAVLRLVTREPRIKAMLVSNFGKAEKGIFFIGHTLN